MGTRRIEAKFERELGSGAGRLLRTVVAQAAEAAPSKPLRVYSFSRAHSRAREQFPSKWPSSGARDSAGCAGVPHRLRHHQMIPANETILGNPRNHPETNGGNSVANDAAVRTPGGS